MLSSVMHVRTKHLMGGTMLSSRLASIVGKVLRVVEPRESQVEEHTRWQAGVSKLYCAATHSSDPATILRHLCPESQCNRSYNAFYLCSAVPLDSWLGLRINMTPAGTASIALAYAFIASLTETGELVLLPSFDRVATVLRLARQLRLIGLAAGHDQSRRHDNKNQIYKKVF